MSSKPHLLIAMRTALRPLLFSDEALSTLDSITHVDTALTVRTEILLTGWDCPVVDEAFLADAPNLTAIVHAGGSVKHHVTQACWDRGILVSCAAAINAIPVAEYTVAAIIMANKRVFSLQQAYSQQRDGSDWLDWTNRYPDMGNYRRTIGIVGCSRVGRLVIEMLAKFDLQVLVHDPYLDSAEAALLGAIPVELDELIARSNVVSLHAPATDATRNLIDERRLALMRDGTTLINTARGSLVDTAALTREVLTGRIHAVLDVIEPDPLPADSPLFDLPNVLLTPHIAGSLAGELRRVGDSAVSEVKRYVQGLPLAWPVHSDQLAYLA